MTPTEALDAREPGGDVVRVLHAAAGAGGELGGKPVIAAAQSILWRARGR